MEDGRKDNNACRPLRGGLSAGRLVAHRIRCAGRACPQGDHRLPRTRGNGEALFVRLVRGAQEGPTDRPQSEDGYGSANFAATGYGVQALGDSQATHQRWVGRERWWVGRPRRVIAATVLPETRQKPDSEAALNKAPDAFRTISEVADDLDLPQHVLRFWESRFPQIRPMKRGGGRRYYRPDDIDLLRGIRHLLYGDGYTIRGVQRILREHGVRSVQSIGQGHAVTLPVQPREEGREEDDAEGARGIFKFLPRFSGGPAQAEAEEEQGAEEAEDEGREGAG